MCIERRVSIQDHPKATGEPETVKNNKYSKTLFRYTIAAIVLFMLCSIIFALVLAKFVINYNTRQLGGFYLDKVAQTGLNVQTDLKKTKYHALTMAQDQVFSEWTCLSYDDKLLAHSILRTMATYRYTDSLIARIQAVNVHTDRILDSEIGSVSLDEFQAEFPEEAYAQAHPNTDFSFFHRNGDIFFALPVNPSERTDRPVANNVILTLDADSFYRSLIQPISSKTSVEALLLDREGNIIAGSTKEQVYRYLEANIDRDVSGSIFDKQYYIASTVIEPEGWTLHYIVPLSTFYDSIIYLVYTLIAISIVILALITVFMLYRLRKIFVPYRNLAQVIHNQLATGEERESGESERALDEYDIIASGFRFLEDSVDKLNNYSPIIQDGLLRKWIGSGILGNDIREYLENHTSLMDYPEIRMVVIRVEAYTGLVDAFDHHYVKTVKSGMCTAVKQLFDDRKWPNVEVDLGEDHIVAIFSDRGQGAKEIEDALAMAKLQIKEFMEIKTSVSLSRKIPIVANIRDTYDRIYMLNMMNFMYNKQIVYGEEAIEQYDDRIMDIEEMHLPAQIREMLYLGRRGYLDQVLAKLEQVAKNLPYTECRYQLIFCIHDIFAQFQKYRKPRTYKELEKTFGQLGSVDAIIAWLGNELEDLADQIQGSSASQHKAQVASRIKNNIQEHLSDCTLSVDQIAEAFSYSPGYIRLTFKEIYKTSLSQYIVHERVRHAKMLLASTDLSLTEIMEQSGFQSQSHFFTSFKKIVGVTPSQYRKQDPGLR
jgi:AraC-like DNA-binding protein